MNASVLVGVSARSPLAKGAWIPSTADEVCAEMRNAAFRAKADWRWGVGLLQSHDENDTPVMNDRKR